MKSNVIYVIIKGKVVDHTIEEVGKTCLDYNTLRVDG